MTLRAAVHRLLCTAAALSPLLYGFTDASAQSCFAGRTRPGCGSFWITEAGLSTRLDPHATGESGSVTLELGHMVNHGRRAALGGAVFLRGGDPVNAIGVRPRFRYWLGERTSLDLAPGLVVATFGGQFARRSPSFSGQLTLEALPGVGFTLQMDQLRYGESERPGEVAWYAGARLGGGLGVAGILGFLGLSVLVAATW